MKWTVKYKGVALYTGESNVSDAIQYWFDNTLIYNWFVQK